MAESMSDATDTETMLAILASLLEPPIPQQAALLDALISAKGDVEAAASSLRARQPAQTRKRIASGVLDSWLTASPSESSQLHKKSKTSITTKIVSSQAHNDESSNTISVVPLKDILRPPPLSVPAVPRLAPLTLSNPMLVEKHTPCTLHLSVLPPELASRLFYVMVNASKEWTPNKWWLFDRVVESPHKTAFYIRKFDGVTDDGTWHEAAQYWYNGRPTATPSVFPSEMEEACQIIENIVNHTLQSRRRYPLEWGGCSNGFDRQTWKANVAASNCYTEGGKEGVGFHSDQLTYLGPFPTIASLSLGTSRTFRLREVIPNNEADTRQAQTFNIPVVHNSLVIMHASTQERFKHSIPPQRAIDVFRSSYPPPPEMQMERELGTSRINITFRFYRPDFRPKSIPKCRCDIPCVLRANMKQRVEVEDMHYFWMCYAGAQNDGKGCGFVKVMDCESEGRGPFMGDREPSPAVQSS
ncbi:hypothetical protein BU17DRAFT_45166 [Hysterangium stoloniferum]|nr:hypothetical protein BU17DRAFT_45166 [Hysterangium stoloniferum]